jgi:hypothetical protein
MNRYGQNIRHKAASLGNFSEIGNRRQPILGCKLHNKSTVHENQLVRKIASGRLCPIAAKTLSISFIRRISS